MVSVYLKKIKHFKLFIITKISHLNYTCLLKKTSIPMNNLSIKLLKIYIININLGSQQIESLSSINAVF